MNSFNAFVIRNSKSTNSEIRWTILWPSCCWSARCSLWISYRTGKENRNTKEEHTRAQIFWGNLVYQTPDINLIFQIVSLIFPDINLISFDINFVFLDINLSILDISLVFPDINLILLDMNLIFFYINLVLVG